MHILMTVKTVSHLVNLLVHMIHGSVQVKKSVTHICDKCASFCVLLGVLCAEPHQLHNSGGDNP
jgi:hypothetical protein